MIGLLRGRPLEDDDGRLVLEVAGVGYELAVPLGTLGRAPEEDGFVTLRVHTHVREDAIELFGFATAQERTAFRTLIGISRVGPKLAMAVLSAVTVAELTQLVESGQATLLAKIPGIGKRTAERMLVELKGKLDAVAAAPSRARAAPAATQAGILVEALVRMGFKRGDVERTVATMEDLDRPMSDLIREALAALAP